MVFAVTKKVRVNMDTDELFICGKELPQKLTKEQLYELLSKVKQGDLIAKEKIVIHNIRLVVYLVVKYFDSVEYDKKDLISIGNIGLLKAIDTLMYLKMLNFLLMHHVVFQMKYICS